MPGARSNPEGNPVLYFLHLFRIRRHAVSTDDVPQVLNRRLQQSALGILQLQTSTSESSENVPQTTDVCPEVWGDHNDVIEVDQQCLPVKSTKDLFHQSLEGGRGGGQPKRQHLPFL